MKQSQIHAENLLKGFTNADEIRNDALNVTIQKAIADGKIRAITPEELKEQYGGKYFTDENVQKFRGELDALIQKGEVAKEDEDQVGMTEQEFAYLEKGESDFAELERVLLTDGTKHQFVYIRKAVEGEDTVEETEEEENSDDIEKSKKKVTE